MTAGAQADLFGTATRCPLYSKSGSGGYEDIQFIRGQDAIVAPLFKISVALRSSDLI